MNSNTIEQQKKIRQQMHEKQGGEKNLGQK